MLSSQDDFGWQGLFLFFLVLSAFHFFTKKACTQIFTNSGRSFVFMPCDLSGGVRK
jgi:hypothetical protein